MEDNWRRNRLSRKCMSSETSWRALLLHRWLIGHEWWAYWIWPERHIYQEIQHWESSIWCQNHRQGEKWTQLELHNCLIFSSYLWSIVKLFVKQTRLRGLTGALTVSVRRRCFTTWYSPMSRQFNWSATEESASKKKKTRRKLKYWQKHPLKVYVWGGICQQGATHFVIFTGIMNPTKYGDILSAYLLLYIEEELSDGHRLYQENDPKHTSKYIQRFFEQNGVTWRRSPIKSPDLNPIELVWGSANAGIEFLRSTLQSAYTILCTGVHVGWVTSWCSQVVTTGICVSTYGFTYECTYTRRQ